MRIGSLLAGLAGIFFVTIVGNLGNAKLLFDQIAERSTAGVAGSGVLSGLLNFLSGAVAVISGKSPLAIPERLVVLERLARHPGHHQRVPVLHLHLRRPARAHDRAAAHPAGAGRSGGAGA